MERQDVEAQLAVLRRAILIYPMAPTIFGLSSEINEEKAFARFDVVERAVRELVGARLLQCSGARLWPDDGWKSGGWLG